MAKAELIAKLVEYGYDKEEVDDMKVADMKVAIENFEKAQNTISQAVETKVADKTIEPVDTQDTHQDVPVMGHPGWSEHVLKQFQPNELENGNPKVDGLRRVAFLILGPFSSLTEIKQTPDLNNAGRASVVVTLSFHGATVCGAADVFSGNTDKEFAVHPVATAETRAEGRALRKALMLSKVLAAEEISKVGPDEPTGDDARAPTSLISTVKMMSHVAHIDLDRLIKHMGMVINDVNELTKAQAKQAANQIGRYVRHEDVMPETIRSV